MKNYILKNKIPVIEPDLLKWAKWYETADKIVKKTKLPGGVVVSTVFLGIDHSFGCEGDPILFETMIFKGEHDQYQIRYTTWNEALKGHKEAISLVFEVTH